MTTTPIRATAPTNEALRSRYRAEGFWGVPQHIGAIEKWATRDPDRIAVVDPYGSFSYAELDDSIARARRWLEDRDVGPGDAVVGVLPNWFESIALYHAVLRAGAVAAPLSMHTRLSELEHVVGATRARVLVVAPNHADLASQLSGAERVDHVGLLATTTESAPATTIRGAQSSQGSLSQAGDIAVVLFTSGSTARPKGAIHTHETLAVANQNLTWALGLDESDVYYVPAPLAHIGGLMHGLHMPFETGARVVLDDRWEPSRAADRVAAEGVTFLGGAPIFPQGLVDAFADRAGSPVRVVCTGGASIPDRLGDDVRTVLGARLARSYGSTECPFASGSLPDDTAEQCDADDGALMPSVEARVGGSDEVEAEGELLLRAACQFQGYLDEAQNRDVIRDGWFATGDVVARRGPRIKVSGRLKAIAIRNGENISLDEVERAFDDWADATEVAAFAVADDRTGERVVLAVVLRDGDAPSYEAMIAHLADRPMARQKYPEQVVAWPSLPRTASGKVDRPALVAGVESRPTAFAPRLRTGR